MFGSRLSERKGLERVWKTRISVGFTHRNANSFIRNYLDRSTRICQLSPTRQCSWPELPWNISNTILPICFVAEELASNERTVKKKDKRKQRALDSRTSFVVSSEGLINKETNLSKLFVDDIFFTIKCLLIADRVHFLFHAEALKPDGLSHYFLEPSKELLEKEVFKLAFRCSFLQISKNSGLDKTFSPRKRRISDQIKRLG